MPSVAYLLICSGFISAAYIASLSPDQVLWLYFFISIFAGTTGVVILRQSRVAAVTADHVLYSNRGVLLESLQRIETDLAALQSESATMETEAIRHAIDRRLRGDLMAFAEARQTLSHLYGLRNFAEVMSTFAAGERYLNRAWSASTDGYGEEARTYLGKALAQMRQTLEKVEELAAQPIVYPKVTRVF